MNSIHMVLMMRIYDFLKPFSTIVKCSLVIQDKWKRLLISNEEKLWAFLFEARKNQPNTHNWCNILSSKCSLRIARNTGYKIRAFPPKNFLPSLETCVASMSSRFLSSFLLWSLSIILDIDSSELRIDQQQ